MKYEIVGIEHAVGDFTPTTGKNANTVQHYDVYLEYHYVLSPPWVRVCLDLAVRPTGKVKYLLCCVFRYQQPTAFVKQRQHRTIPA